ncbi:hypothetical protein LGR54_00665 [Ancylobacter sp. Lp-2]|uniref:Nmad2 family putative nucleotide modification protein n=1 Tax=Ancylobacter sp. Lp-2 TaxID=2881339 RepID=UPI001E5CBC31|nr:hypothetical protein [Ancylobacter sp. Lp-2]MCB4767105.1 hypothetical protein [Ancylobacter sp. Lp-2]
MRLHSYVIEHDVGFAPNPFHGWCSLAACKPMIRATAAVGDHVIGTGTAHNKMSQHLIYWMRVDEIIDFDAYWSDQRFHRKRAVMHGSMAQRHGDNIYHSLPGGGFFQADSFHSREDGRPDPANLNRDTSRTQRVLLGRSFAYYGKHARLIPDEFKGFIKRGPGHRNNFSAVGLEHFTAWLFADPGRGYIAEPTDWR